MSISVQDGVPLDDTTFSYSVEQSCPRLVVILNGYASIGVSATCTQNAHGFNDTAEVVIPLDRDYSVELADAATATSAKAPNPNVTIEVWAGLADTPQYGSTSLSGLRRIFLGLVDDYAAAGVLATITLHCRGAAANLADLKLTKIALGQTSVSFGAEEAAAAGLKFEQNLTLSPITIQQVLGKEFVGGPSLQTSIYRKSAADLLKESATFDDADVWVEDGTVHYERAALVKRGNPIAIHHGHDTVMGDEGLSLSHALRFSKNVRVDVRGFQPRVRISTRATLRFDPTTGAVTKETVSTGMSRSTPIFGTDQTQSLNISKKSLSQGTSTSSGGSSSSTETEASSSNVERYKFFVPNVDGPTCSRLAAAIARQIASLEYSVSLTVPMTRKMLGLRIVTPLDVTGIALSAFSTRYYPRKITHTISLESGWRVNIQAVSHAILQGELD